MDSLIDTGENVKGTQGHKIKMFSKQAKRSRMHIMTNLLDKILDRQNMYQALKSVCSNKGSSGVDGITIDEIDGYIR